MKNKLLSYLKMMNQLEKQGGVENSGSLFESIIILEAEILINFGLPRSEKFCQILWSFKTEEQMDQIILNLQSAAEQYLSEVVKTDINILREAAVNKSPIEEIFPEIGISMHDYTIYVYNHKLLTLRATPQEVLEEFRKVECNDNLNKIYTASTSLTPLKNIAYKELVKVAKLQFIDEYLNYIKENSPISKVDKELDVFELSDLLIHTVTIMGSYSVSLRCSETSELIESPFTLSCTIIELAQFLFYNDKYGISLLEHINCKIQEENNDSYSNIINVEELVGQPVIVDNFTINIKNTAIENAENGIEDWMNECYYLHSLKPIIINTDDDSKFEENSVSKKLDDTMQTLSQTYKSYLKLSKFGLTYKECRSRSGLNDEMLFLLAYLVHKVDTPAGDVNDMELKSYIHLKIFTPIDEKDLDEILEGFWIRWNKTVFKMVGDGDLKNAVYQYLESLNKEVNIPQKIVDAAIDLTLEYLHDIGMWD